MIRRAANLIGGTAQAPTSTPVFVLGWLVKVDANGNQTMNMVYEETNHGFVSETPATTIQFQDGCPPVIPVIA